MLGFLLLVAWFQTVQPYERFFFEATRIELWTHTAARILLLPYLFCILFGLGRIGLRLCLDKATLPITPIEEIAITVLAGSAVLRLAMFALGFAGLYYTWPMALAGAAALAIGSRRLWALIKEILPSFKAIGTSLPVVERLATATLLVALAMVLVTVLVQKSLYPGGSGDYFSHYLHYYLEVLKRHDLWPNNVWYHFYISKGAGDVFYAMLVSDPLAPAAVSMVMYGFSILAAYAFLKRMTGDRLVSLLGTVIMASAFIATFEYRLKSVGDVGFIGWWAEFNKEHMLNGVLLFGSVWAGWLLMEMPRSARHGWWNIAALCAAGMIVFRPQMCVFYGGFLGILCLFSCLRRDYALARFYIGLALVAGGGAVLLWSFNMAVTGLADVSPFRLFWSLADQEKLSAWVSPFLPLVAVIGMSQDLGGIAFPDFGSAPFWPAVGAIFRLDKALPYFALYGVPFVLAAIAGIFALRRHREDVPRALWSGVFALGAIFLLSAALFFCVNQITSMFRMYVFSVYWVTLIGAIPFALAHYAVRARPKWRNVFMAIIAALGLLGARQATLDMSRTLEQQTWDFFYGEKTISHVLAEQMHLRSPKLDACRQVRQGARMWLFNAWGPGVMAPHCPLETFYSYSMGPDWSSILFEDPPTAVRELKKQRIDYFLIDTNFAFFDILPYSALFSPANIKRYLQVAWAENGVYLLTWPSADTRPIPDSFFADYRKYFARSDAHADFEDIYRALAHLYFKWKPDPYWPIEPDPSQPRPRGWQ